MALYERASCYQISWWQKLSRAEATRAGKTVRNRIKLQWQIYRAKKVQTTNSTTTSASILTTFIFDCCWMRSFWASFVSPGISRCETCRDFINIKMNFRGSLWSLFLIQMEKNRLEIFSRNYLEPYKSVTNRYHYHGQQIARQKIGEQEVQCSVWMVRPLLQAHFDVWSLRKYWNKLKIHRPR